MLRLINVELYKVYTKPRSYIGFGIILLIVAVFDAGMYAEGENLVKFATEALTQSFAFEGQIINGNLATYMLMNTLLIHIPILVALVAGDILAGEFSSGTIRLLMQRPFSRFQIYYAKVIVGMIYTVSLMVFLFILSYVLGMGIFGEGDLVVLRRGISVFDSDDVFWRLGLAFLMGTLSMLVVTALAHMYSAFAKNSIGPIVGAIATLIGLNIISALGFKMLAPILPYLFNIHFIKWQYFFDYDIDTAAILLATIVQFVYILIFYLIGYVKFKNQDILY